MEEYEYGDEILRKLPEEFRAFKIFAGLKSEGDVANTRLYNVFCNNRKVIKYVLRGLFCTF